MPTTNPFFSNVSGYTGEENLIDDLVIEQIAIYGLDIMYMPRKMLNFDRFLNESTKSIFESSLSIPVYIKSYSGYNNGMELLTKFGVRASDELVVVISKSQFKTYYSPFLKSYYNQVNEEQDNQELPQLIGQTTERPKEGDLIYFPFDGGIFEVKYVNVDGEFFQLGKNYVFELTLEKFEYSGEIFDTSVDEIDQQQTFTNYYRMEFQVDPEGYQTFFFNEEVRIYNAETAITVGPQGPQGAQDFELYAEQGFLQDVPYVTAKVMKWNKLTNTLILGNISDEDPTQRELITLNTNQDKFKESLIIGQESGAIYATVNAKMERIAFNDDEEIQEEFDIIKVIDIEDENPFGFT